MSEVCQETRRQFLQNQIGKQEQVLFETTCHDDVYEGYTENYTPVWVHSPVSLCGKLLPVKIMQADAEHCIGELIGK